MTLNLSIQSMAIDTFVPVLRTLSTLLTKGAGHATAAKSDGAVIVNARRAPDMLPLGLGKADFLGHIGPSIRKR